MENFNYKDSFVAVRNYKTGKLPKEMVRKCFCCSKDINDCEVTLLINNYKYIPNVLMHRKCADGWQHKTDELCDDIVSSYNDFKLLNSIFGSWVN